MIDITRDSRCPFCGSRMTDFHYSHSDGESARMAIGVNQCVNNNCGLPVRLWDKVVPSTAIRELEAELRNKARDSREEAIRIRATIKDHSDAEERCNVRAEVWEQDADRLAAILKG